MATENDFETELNAEVTKRLEQMQSPDYEFPPRMKKIDFIIAGVMAVIALVITEVATLTAGVM